MKTKISLYPVVYRYKYFAEKILNFRIKKTYNADIFSYTNTFRQKYQSLFKHKTKSESPGPPVVALFSTLPLSYSMHVESIIARKLETAGFRIVVLTPYSCKMLSDNIHRKIYGLSNIFFIQDFMHFSISREAAKIIEKLKQERDIEELKKIKYKNTNIGLHALASFSAGLSSGKVDLNRGTMAKIARIAVASCRYVEAVERFISLVKPNKVLTGEKGFVSTCELLYESVYGGIDYIQKVGCHQPNSLMLKRYNTGNIMEHPFSVSLKTWSKYAGERAEYADCVLDIFKEGYVKGEWFIFKKLVSGKLILTKEQIMERFGLDRKKKTAIIFSHILNDANFFYGRDLFKGGFQEWLVRTIKAASRNSQVNWLLKLHPANIYRRENLKYTGEYGEVLAIKDALGQMPRNVVVIPADTDINPYSFFTVADYGITVRGTVGAELPCFGVAVLTAGTGRYSGRGFTIDSASAEEYLDKVSNIHKVKPLSEYQRNQAIKHACLFFKERPAKYDTFLRDIYPYPTGHPLHRDIEITDSNLWENKQLCKIADFIAFSKEEDYLENKND